MRPGKLIIDGIDAWLIYGVSILDAGLNTMLSWPASKEVDTADWAEGDYIQADLSDLLLGAKDASLNLVVCDRITDLTPFFAFLESTTYRTWEVRSIGRSFRLRYVGVDSFDAHETYSVCRIKVSIDTPLAGYTYEPPVSSIGDFDEYLLDGKRLSDYGVRVLLGTLDSTARGNDVKGRLLRDISVLDGVIYDATGSNKMESREMTLQCAMIDTTFGGLWRNYDALLYDLTRKDQTAVYDTDRCQRHLHSVLLNKSYPCYYIDQEVREFSPGGDKIWLLFDLRFRLVK